MSVCNVGVLLAVSELRSLIPGFSYRRLGFKPRVVHVEFVRDKMTLRQFSCECFGSTLPIIIPLMIQSHDISSSSAETTVSLFEDETEGTQFDPISVTIIIGQSI
jgi:hypothetical protein